MTAVSDVPERAPARANMRAYARLGDERRVATPAPVRTADEAVTLDKIGDFLELDLRRFAFWVRSGLLAVMALALVGAVSGALFSVLAKPRFTVSTELLIDPDNLQVFDTDPFAASGQLDNQLLVTGSKVRVLTSRNVLTRVVTELDLANDPEFYDPNAFNLKALLGATPPVADPQASAVENLNARVGTELDERSFVVTLSVSAQTTDKAIAISAAMIKSFKDELAAADADSAAQAAIALDQRLAGLRSDVEAAETRVETFKRDNNLATSNGQLVTSQSLTQLNTEFVAAQSRAIAAQANYAALLAGGANVRPEMAGSASIVSLRDKVSTVQQQLSAASMIYGPLHPRITSLTAELNGVNGQIQRELSRAIETARNESDQAAAVVASLTQQLDSLTSSTFADGDLQVKLRELERDAAAKTSVYENFLSRERQVAELQEINTTNVRTISTAVPPEGRSWPPGIMVMAIVGALGGALLGLVFAVLAGVTRDMRSSTRPAAANSR